MPRIKARSGLPESKFLENTGTTYPPRDWSQSWSTAPDAEEVAARLPGVSHGDPLLGHYSDTRNKPCPFCFIMRAADGLCHYC